MSTLAKAPPGPLRAIGTVAVIGLLAAGYIGLCLVAHVTALYAGFLFVLYWFGVHHGDLTQFWPALLGAMVGVLLAWLLRAAPERFGMAGSIGALAAICVAIYLQVRGQLSLLVNLSTMIVLTVVSIPALTAQGDFGGMIAAIAIAGAYGGALTLLTAWLTARAHQAPSRQPRQTLSA